MNIVGPTLAAFAAYGLGYRFYSRFLADKIFVLDDAEPTPAVRFEDGVDHVPTRSSVAFGHHFASITGLAPMLGPAVAVIWGWLPAMLWVVLGAIWVGCVHDFSALVLSLRAQGQSMAAVAEGVLGRFGRLLFYVVILFGVSLAMGVFVFVIGNLFSVEIAPGVAGFPGATAPSAGLIGLALVVGYRVHRCGNSLFVWAALAFGLSLLLIYAGYRWPTWGVSKGAWPGIDLWVVVLLAYAFVASVAPVWLLLQARDFINSLLLYLGMAAAYVGIFVLRPEFQAPALRTEVPGAPSMLPFVFVIIACGAASGFHGLVASGTTSKQLGREGDARLVGYGGMLAESLLGLLAVLATTAGFSSSDAWHGHYGSWSSAQGLATKVGAFVEGAGRFIGALGVPASLASAFVAVVVVSFALTTLDSATRLLRYTLAEMAKAMGQEWAASRYVASFLAVVCIGVFAFYKVDGKPAALALWTLFGTTNQLLAGMTLLTATLYLRARQKNFWFTGVPCVAMLGMTVVAMTGNLIGFWQKGQVLLGMVGGALWLIAWAVILVGVLVFRRGAKAASMQISIS